MKTEVTNPLGKITIENGGDRITLTRINGSTCIVSRDKEWADKMVSAGSERAKYADHSAIVLLLGRNERTMTGRIGALKLMVEVTTGIANHVVAPTSEACDSYHRIREMGDIETADRHKMTINVDTEGNAFLTYKGIDIDYFQTAGGWTVQLGPKVYKTLEEAITVAQEWKSMTPIQRLVKDLEDIS